MDVVEDWEGADGLLMVGQLPNSNYFEARVRGGSCVFHSQVIEICYRVNIMYGVSFISCCFAMHFLALVDGQERIPSLVLALFGLRKPPNPSATM